MKNQKQKKQLYRLDLDEKRIILLVGDLIVGIIALVISLFLWASSADWLGFSPEFFQVRVQMWFYFLPLIWLLLLIELYDPHLSSNRRKTINGIFIAALMGLMLYMFAYFSSEPSSLPRSGVAYFLILASLLTLGWRMIYIKIFTSSQFMRRVLVVGAGKGGEAIINLVTNMDPSPFLVIGVVDDDPSKIGLQIQGYEIIDSCSNLLKIIDEYKVTDIIVAISGEMQGSTFQLILDAQEMGIRVSRLPVMYEDLLRRVPIRFLEADWLMRSFVDESRVNRFYELGKRIIDILGGLIGVLLLVIVFPFIGLAILIESGWPIFYLQTRLGRGGIPYPIIKFRTMGQNAEPDGVPLWAEEGDQRATRFGIFLRKSHLDEIPQFLNVVKGEMSLVGPRSERPALVNHFQDKIPFYRARLIVKPGLSGWAQVNYPYAATVEQTIIKLEYDLYYIKHRNIILDAVIILRTPAMMLGMRGR